jgi:hypothetical protein
MKASPLASRLVLTQPLTRTSCAGDELSRSSFIRDPNLSEEAKLPPTELKGKKPRIMIYDTPLLERTKKSGQKQDLPMTEKF